MNDSANAIVLLVIR